MNFEKSAVRFWYSYFIVLEITKMDGKSEDSVKIICKFFRGLGVVKANLFFKSMGILMLTNMSSM